MNPTALSLDQDLACIPFIDDTEWTDLKDELSTYMYLSKVADLDDAYDPLEWLKSNASALLCWSQVAQKILPVQPSSAAAESLFTASMYFQRSTGQLSLGLCRVISHVAI